MKGFSLKTILALFPVIGLIDETIEDGMVEASEIGAIVNVFARAFKVDIKLVDVTDDGKLVLQLPNIKVKK